MDVTVFGDELLKAYRGDLGISATKTNVTVTKDGVSYQAGRTLPIGTYTIVATPQGSATLTSLEVNGESFVSGGTISVIFGTNINITAVSEGGEPEYEYPTPGVYGTDGQLRMTWEELQQAAPDAFVGTTIVDNNWTSYFRDIINSGESIVIAEGITRIEHYAFIISGSLAKVTLPSSVEYIDEHALGMASAGIILCYAQTPPTLGSDRPFHNWFNNSGEATINVLPEVVNTYKSATGWSTYASIIKPMLLSDLANTSWTYTVGDSYTLTTESALSALVNLTVSFKYNNIDYSLSSDSDLLSFGSGSFNGNFNIYKNDSVKYPRLRYYAADGVQYCFTSLSDYISLPIGTVIRFDFGESTVGSKSDFLLQLVQTNFTRIE